MRIGVGHDRFHGRRVKEIPRRVVVGGRRDDDKGRAGVGLLRVERGAKVQILARQKSPHVGIVDGRLPRIQSRYLLRKNIQGNHLVVLRQEQSIGQADIARSHYGNFQGPILG